MPTRPHETQTHSRVYDQNFYWGGGERVVDGEGVAVNKKILKQGVGKSKIVHRGRGF